MNPVIKEKNDNAGCKEEGGLIGEGRKNGWKEKMTLREMRRTRDVEWMDSGSVDVQGEAAVLTLDVDSSLDDTLQAGKMTTTSERTHEKKLVKDFPFKFRFS